MELSISFTVVVTLPATIFIKQFFSGKKEAIFLFTS